MLESKSKPAFSSPPTMEPKHPAGEAAIKVQPRHPESNNPPDRADLKHAKKPKHTVVRQQVVHFATNRQRLEETNGLTAFGQRPGPLVLGMSQTVVGSGYQPGKLTGIRIESLEIHANPVDLSELFPDPKAKAKPVLVFVHGFCVEIDEAIRRVTQIVHELDFDGHAFVYAWPSANELTFESYLKDQLAIKASVKSCRGFLQSLADHFGAQNVQLLAHSLGCRLIAKTIQSVHSEQVGGNDPLLQNLIFAAPDIEMGKFQKHYLPALTSAVRRVSVYFSSKDLTLAVAQSLDGQPRLGHQGVPSGSHPRIEVINYSHLPGSFWNVSTHNLFREHPAMIRDIRGVLSGSIPLSDRKLQDMPKSAKL